MYSSTTTHLLQIRQIVFFFSLALHLHCLAQNSQHDDTLLPYYRVFGKGQPVLIINGGPGMNSNGFTEVAQKIADLGYQTITFDQRGTGNSKLDTLNEKTITMDAMADDIERLRQHLNMEQWTVLGHSFGGLMACHYYAKYPEHVDKLIFSSSGGVNLNFMNYLQSRIQNNLTPDQRDSLKFYQNKLANGDTSRITRVKRAEFLANAYVVNKSYTKRIAGRLMELNPEVNSLVIQNLRNMHFDYFGKFLQSKTPVLVIQGTNDIISTETAEQIRASFGNADIRLISNCAHYGWLDRPDEYFGAIRAFLEQ
ncbi:MAG: alpha/beta hydrolase [Bacteroidetes bacterium]|nr:alpha/beta hydrolase [Bacteroidota bacterium]